MFGYQIEIEIIALRFNYFKQVHSNCDDLIFLNNFIVEDILVHRPFYAGNSYSLL